MGYRTQSVRLDVLRAIASGITSGAPFDDVVWASLELSAGKFSRCWLAVRTIGSLSRPPQSYSRPPGNWATSGAEIEPTPAYLTTLALERALVIPRVEEFKGFDLSAWVKAGVQSLVDIPLVHSDRLVGVLSCRAPAPREWADAEVETLAEIGSYLSMALKSAEAQEHQRKAEGELRESQEQFRQMAESIREVFWLTSPERKRVLYVSPAYEEVWGRACRSLYDAPGDWLRSIHPEDRGRVAAAMSKQALGGFDETYRIVRPDGSMRWIRDRAFPVTDAHGKVVRIAGVADDITEARKAEDMLKSKEDQLRAIQKMEAIGLLAGGVAHDFNNILTGIIGYSELGLRALPPDHQVQRYLTEIRAAAERAAALTRQLLAFGRRQVLNATVIDVNEVLAGVESMLRRVIGEDIELKTAAGPDLGRVKADWTQVEQIILNLVVNARDAMPKGGRITVETANESMDELYAGAHPGARPGRYVMMAVSDSGVGMDRETQARIFEPFFTTKAQGKGTGLGLSTVYGIVKQSEGYIAVYSEPGLGTTFRVYFPRVEGELSPVAEAPRDSDQRAREEETILVVEDNSMVRDLVCSGLRSAGFRVLEAPTPEDALALSDNYRGHIHLLLTDVVMPGMAGPEVAMRVRKDRPKTRILFMSGYAPAAMEGRDLLDVGAPLLPKPFRRQVLLGMVRQVLDAPPTR